jgi:hypothetical protein
MVRVVVMVMVMVMVMGIRRRVVFGVRHYRETGAGVVSLALRDYTAYLSQQCLQISSRAVLKD